MDRKKYKLPGHKRMLKPCGKKEDKKNFFPDGWEIECSCGWISETKAKSKRIAEQIYSEHIKNSLPVCHCCNETKTTREMSKSNSVLCKKCVTKKTKEWGLKNPNEWDRYRRKSFLKRKYNITIEEYNKIIEKQNNVCAICFGNLNDSRGFRPHIDHDHETGKIRGVLCGNCNKGLGMFKDNKEIILNAYNYLLKSK